MLACRAAEDLRYTTSGFLIDRQTDGGLVDTIEKATNEIAQGDGESSAKKRKQAYEKARHTMRKYLDEVDKLERQHRVTPYIAATLSFDAQEIVSDLDALIAAP